MKQKKPTTVHKLRNKLRKVSDIAMIINAQYPQLAALLEA